MSSQSTLRLSLERQNWKKNHPFGFVAKPERNPDGTLNMMIWNCIIPGKINTPWENGNYSLRLFFPDDYPSSPPQCLFSVPLFHPNICSHGHIYVPLLNEPRIWNSSYTVLSILTAIQDILHNPNETDIFNFRAHHLYKTNRMIYDLYVVEHARYSSTMSFF